MNRRLESCVVAFVFGTVIGGLIIGWATAPVVAQLPRETAEPVLAGPWVKLPVEIRAEPGEWILIAAEVDGGLPRWRWSPGLAEVKLDALFPPDVLAKAKGRVFKGRAGEHWVEAWNAKDSVPSDIARCRVLIGVAAQPPPVAQPPATPTKAQYYVVVVRPNGAYSAALAAHRRDAAWDRIAARGVKVAWPQISAPGPDGKVLSEDKQALFKGVPLPAILIFHEELVGIEVSSLVDLTARPLPSPAEVEKLVSEFVK